MLQNHSSKWSAAASPGGLIGLFLTIFALMALGLSILSLAGRFEIALSETIIIVMLGVSVFAAVILVYLLVAYVTISYRLEPEQLRIRCGLWSATIPYDEMESVEPITDVLGEDGLGWVPYWPGYYLGVRSTDVGNVRVVATLPPRRQIAIVRSDGEIFAISPERPQLFIEDLARWHGAYFAWLEHQDVEATDERPAAIQASGGDLFQRDHEPANQPAAHFVHDAEDTNPVGYPVAPAPAVQPAFGYQGAPEPADETIEEPEPKAYPVPPAFGTQEAPEPSGETVPEPEPQDQPDPPAFGHSQVADYPEEAPEPPRQPDPASHDAMDQPREAEPSPEPVQPEPGPVFGTSQPASEEPQGAPKFGFTPPEVEPSYRPADHFAGQEPTEESETPTDQLRVWYPEPPARHDHSSAEQAYQHFADAGWTTEQAAVEQEPQSAEAAPFAPPKPVIAPHGTPRREVMQPLTRVQRAEPVPTSPALRPMIHQDPVSLGFVSVSLLTGLAMVGYLLIQWDDIPPSLTLHWNAEGLPGRVGEAREIWILPLIAGIVFLANIGLAWSIAQFDRFAARLTLSSTVIAHIVIWIALLMILG